MFTDHIENLETCSYSPPKRRVELGTLRLGWFANLTPYSDTPGCCSNKNAYNAATRQQSVKVSDFVCDRSSRFVLSVPFLAHSLKESLFIVILGHLNLRWATDTPHKNKEQDA
jgi:hypothetical protein